MMKIQIEGKGYNYSVHAENDRGEVYQIDVTEGWGELKYSERTEGWANPLEVEIETIAIEGKTLEQVMTQYVLPDLT